MTMSPNFACQAITEAEPHAVYVTTMGAMNVMDKLDAGVLSVACVPLMGGAASLGLGIALARKDKQVVVLDGDASLLMELGGLVTVAQARPHNFVHFVLNNGVQFAGLGNLDTPGCTSTDFAGLAHAAGYRSTFRVGSADEFKARLADILDAPAPTFVELAVDSAAPTLGEAFPAIEMTDARFTRMGDELRVIREALAG
ncbi:thiamine pyrophosphate-dependent enzyme [Pandoraea sp.]|uniref:thiamine pyrophosphate-dependent enzyme n=1 Tax=Pandoraea sp. TaxID=1883445 RepID=UPI0035B247CE